MGQRPTHFCVNCERDFTNPRCPRCGGPPATEQEFIEHTPADDKTALSDLDDTFDHMIEKSSRPTLASLLKRGVASGAITPSHEYSAGDVRSS